MDPNATQREIDELKAKTPPLDRHDKARLTELLQAKREWIQRGGYWPGR
jgi:hypothetical protein